MLHTANDFNLNSVEYEKFKKVQEFLNLIYENRMVSTINKPTRFSRPSATANDHILTI